MGESGNSSGSVDVRRSSRLLKKQIDGLMKTLSLVDESEEIEMEEDEEEWAPRAGKSGAGRVMAKRGERETSATSSSQRRTNRNHAEETAVVDPIKEDVMKKSFVPSVSQLDEVIDLSCDEISDDSDDGDSSSDYESGGEQELIAPLSHEDAGLFAEVMKVIKEGSDLKKPKVEHLKAYLRNYGLRMVGVKAILLSRVQEHLRIKDGQGEDIYPRSSFTINCKGDVCLGDIVLFLQNVYDMPFAIQRRGASGPPLGKRWVAGKVVNESYGAAKQQHTFTIEVLWSTGTRPFYVMRPLLIKGRNLYRMSTLRQPWSNEAERQKVLEEKHARGAKARALRRGVKASRLKVSRTKAGTSTSWSGSRESSRTRDRPAAKVWGLDPTSRPSQHERINNQRNDYRCQDRIASHAQNRDRPTAQDRFHPTASSFHNALQHGRVHTQQQFYQSGLGAHPVPLNHVREREILHIACSTAECDKAGAKQCITRACASCCYRSNSSRGRCSRHL
ncbi:uncharacterized protein [Physcomitrium patens]|uniref:SAP domain-containing protein n=1 Tax=Physcomitrium patens TaxID=3218 RepID=A0A2K1IGT4_PHYPA|nr:zinc finger CCCH domain-containing protein 62-like isoform X3 [Physcomitrium patens]PNR28480.1 hypothetical protein PHYPA_029072 [Physcomitrium patens]|eukprot:XP_024363467.1 zinc finger CCCH domain-containing protein 62-like isoform X3 [Physcomitrella patens]